MEKNNVIRITKAQSLYSFPLSLSEANSLVESYHRSHKKVIGGKFSIAAMNEKGEICGVVIIGKPVARKTDSSKVAEVRRLVSDGTANVCSFLLGISARICTELGYKRIQTFIDEKEPGTSLKAVGWKFDHLSINPKGWKKQNSNKIEEEGIFVLCDSNAEGQGCKQLWIKDLNQEVPLPIFKKGQIMPKISDRPMRRVCVRLWDEDCEALESYATHEKKFNALLRDIVHVFVINAGARLRQKIDELEKEDA